MVNTPAKRTASTSPSRTERPSKRLATSSPEEGELDDSIPPSPPQPPEEKATLAGKSPPPRTQSPQAKARPVVPFPFKTVTKVKDDERDRVVPVDSDKSIPAVYERTEEVKEKIRERENAEEGQRREKSGSSRRHGDSYRRIVGNDHWEPGYESGKERRVWDPKPPYDRYPPREHEFLPRRPELRPPLAAHPRERARSSGSPPSANRSRSSSPSSGHQGVHRLPQPRSPQYAFSPPHREYHVDRRREREYDWRHTEPNDSRPHAPNDGAYYPGREWQNEGDDRHYRPCSPPGDRGKGSRDWSRRRGVDSYRPASPVHLLPHPSSLPPRPQSQLVHPRTPPPPSNPLPPDPSLVAPPVETYLAESVSSKLLIERPGAPRQRPSPSPLSLLPSSASEMKGEGLEKLQDSASKIPDSSPAVVLRPLKRQPVYRSRQAEKEFYGRAFEGCGQQRDYEITTKVGEGTFGEVHKAVQTSSGAIVALKRVLMHNEHEGMPVTALREIKILKALDHPNIVNILDMFVAQGKDEHSPFSVYMVFPYMDHDLAGLLKNDRVKLQPSQIKLYMKQLLDGTEYMHRNNIMHRDMKASNLLISNTGCLRIADFGLARNFDPNIFRDHKKAGGKERKYTNCVVTRWYRPPELFLGARQYGGEVDLWGIGCVFGEMFTRHPILLGKSDMDQLDKIWQLCGTPNQQNWTNYDQLPGIDGVIRFNPTYSRRVKEAYEAIMLGPDAVDLLDKLLVCNPRGRITASQALDHEYFWTDPLPADPKTLPSYEASHEFDKRGRRQQPPQNLPEQLHQRPPLYHNRGQFPPPHRDAFRNPPPPHAQLPPRMGGHGAPPFRSLPPKPERWVPSGSHHALDAPHTKGLPPIHNQRSHDHRDHHHSNRDPVNNWDKARTFSHRPAHLPAKPPMPLDWGDGVKMDHGNEKEGELNYG